MGTTTSSAVGQTDSGAGQTGDRHAAARADLLESLHLHRGLFRVTVRGLSEEQARQRTTVSALTLGGLVKHVAAMEQEWATFARHGAPGADMDAADPEVQARWEAGFRLTDDETLAGALAEWDRTAALMDEVVATADLDATHELPPAPWFEPGARWSVRRVVQHILAEVAQHAGHADIVRESLDGQKTMG